jgi:hypothetical protein
VVCLCFEDVYPLVVGSSKNCGAVRVREELIEKLSISNTVNYPMDNANRDLGEPLQDSVSTHHSLLGRQT